MSAAQTTLAHEYWLEPTEEQWQVGDALTLDIRNGVDFVGSTYPFDPQNLQRAGLISNHSRVPLKGRLGDLPAISMPLLEAGLHLVLLETTRKELIYENTGDFEEFLDYHALSEILHQHREKGFPDESIVEHYYRFCKALIQVENSSSMPQDTQIDVDPALETQSQLYEITANSNPFQSETLEVLLTFQAAPVGNRQIELFHRDVNGNVDRLTARTNTQGRALFDISAAGEYLINSVKVVEAEDSSAHWISLWSSLFFQKH